MRVRGALEEQPVLGKGGSQGHQRPRHRGFVVLAQDIEGSDHAHPLAAREGQIEATVTEGQTRRSKRLRFRHPYGIDFHAQHGQSRVQAPQAVQGLPWSHGVGAKAQIHVEAGQVADEGGKRHRQEGVRLPEAIGGGLAPRGLAKRLSHRARS